MSCCGSKRRDFLPPSNHFSTPVQAADVVFVTFRYTGQQGIAVTGGVTGRKYRFLNPGDEVQVDGRDAPGMSAVPNTVRVYT